jgi:hypothetical protein
MKLRRSLYSRIKPFSEDSSAPRRRSTPAERPSSCRRDAISRWKAASPPSLHGLSSAAGAVHKNMVGHPSARSLGVVAQEVRMPAAPSSAYPRPRPASGVQCPVRATSVHTWLSIRPVSGVRCGRLSVQVSAVGVRCRRPVWASGVCALPRPLCPAEVRSWSAAVGQAAVRRDGRGRRGRPLRPCPARRLPESGAWRSKLAQVVLGQPRRRFGPGRRRGRWLGSGQLDRVADQDRPGAREDHSLVGAGARRGSPSAAG